MSRATDVLVSIRGRTVSLLAEHSVVFHNISVGDTGILSPPKLVVHSEQTVPAPAPANPTQSGSHKADDHYWECSQLTPGVAACESQLHAAQPAL